MNPSTNAIENGANRKTTLSAVVVVTDVEGYQHDDGSCQIDVSCNSLDKFGNHFIIDLHFYASDRQRGKTIMADMFGQHC
jgi:hypothetical protein